MTRTALLRLHNEAGNLRQLDLSGRRKLLSRQAFLRGKYPEADPGRLSFSPPIMPVHERYWSWVEEKRITIIADPAIEEDRVAVAREGITELLTEVGLMINVEIQTMPLLEHFQWTQENADQKCSKKPMDIAVVDHAFDFRTQNLFPPGGLVFLTDYPGIIANYLVTFYGFGAFDTGMAFI